MTHAQKPNFVFRRNGRVHLNRRGRQFSQLLAADVCASAVVMVAMLDTPCSVVLWRVLANHSIRQFPLHFPSRASPCAITFQLESTKNCQYWYSSRKTTTTLLTTYIFICPFHKIHKNEPVVTGDSIYTGCPRRNVPNFERVFLMLNYTNVTQNTCIQSWTVTEIMAIEKRGFLGCPRTVGRPWRHSRPVRMPGNQTPLANVAMQWPWRDYASAAACVKCLVTLRTTMTWVRVFL